MVGDNEGDMDQEVWMEGSGAEDAGRRADRAGPATPAHIPVVILCGGLGTRFKEETQYRPKPMIEIGGRPILWHIMRSYAHHGFRRFILCLGHMGDVIRQYFLTYRRHHLDLTVDLGDDSIELHATGERPELDPGTSWRVTLVDTGRSAMTGARLKRIEPWVDAEHFALTYGDGLADIDLAQALRDHIEHGRTGTVTGIHPPSRFGELVLGDPVSHAGRAVARFSEKPQTGVGSINGGFFFFARRFFGYLSSEDDCVLEREPLERLAADGELVVRMHGGFWQCMDTQRDRDYLERLVVDGTAPWMVWR